jgi:hypothetical protein
MHGRYNLLAGEITDSILRNVLCVFNAEPPVSFTIDFTGFIIHPKDKIIGFVADGMHCHMESGFICP